MQKQASPQNIVRFWLVVGTNIYLEVTQTCRSNSIPKQRSRKHEESFSPLADSSFRSDSSIERFSRAHPMTPQRANDQVKHLVGRDRLFAISILGLPWVLFPQLDYTTLESWLIFQPRVFCSKASSPLRPTYKIDSWVSIRWVRMSYAWYKERKLTQSSILFSEVLSFIFIGTLSTGDLLTSVFETSNPEADTIHDVEVLLTSSQVNMWSGGEGLSRLEALTFTPLTIDKVI